MCCKQRARELGVLAYSWMDGEAKENEGRMGFKERLLGCLGYTCHGYLWAIKVETQHRQWGVGNSGRSQAKSTHLDIGAET